MTHLVGILGHPLSHSISPAFQQAAFDHYSLPIRYQAWPTPPERLADEVGRLRGERYLGANVTLPHKERVSEHLDSVDPWAHSVGAVNTIVKEDGRLVGYNTDADGFLMSLVHKGGFSPAGKAVLLVGAGGAARAAAFGLAREGVARMAIANRTLGRAKELARSVSAHIPSVEAIPLDGPELAGAAAGADLIVNCTTVGMSHGGAEYTTPLRAALIPPSALVFDMVYNPPDTPLLREARAAGARALGGLWMLIYQGAASFRHWTGREAPLEVMFDAAQRAMSVFSARAR